ncbi:MAG: hypothetical protein WD355_02675 [Balneolaceae bacterium]
MEKFIKTNYPDAEDGTLFTNRMVGLLEKEHDFDLGKTLLATSVCSDEIIRSATQFRNHLASKNPFQLGGLAGFPFSGITGLKAFGSHIPDDGSAVILYGPHIGVSGTGEVGWMKRVGQQKQSTCCGALKATLSNFKSEDYPEPDQELDYQLWKIHQQLDSVRESVLGHSEPLVAVTDSMFEKINERMKVLIEHFEPVRGARRIALIGGIVINTDFNLPDWFELRHFEVVGDS